MMEGTKVLFWAAWLFLTVFVGGFYGYTLFADTDKSAFLIGDASHGHYQIELACTACHTEPFGGREMLQNACVDCHGQELEAAHDSHPKKKFTDPRNADMLDIIDARYCVSCHSEHQQENTLAMGLTIPADYCYHCHEDVAEQRETHQGLDFESCASAGCHNYHDNRALYESFLTSHAEEPWLKDTARILKASHAGKTAAKGLVDASSDGVKAQHPEMTQQWLASAHAEAGVDCMGCHGSAQTGEWNEKPGIETCNSCHSQEVATYQQGKHGMRLAQGLSHLTPQDANHSSSAFNSESALLAHSCSSCHDAHSTNTQYAVTEACLTCHADDHSQNFLTSPHAQIVPVDGMQNVTCATCHMPRMLVEENGVYLKLAEIDATTPIDTEVDTGIDAHVFVNHNQNDNLRPNEKMIRPVCMQCHGLAFSIDALADPELIRSNFNGSPSRHVESIDWATGRDK